MKEQQKRFKNTEPFALSRPLQTPVLFMMFNRLEAARQVFSVIRQARPARLYIAADGPRMERAGEDRQVRAVRDYVMGHIDWPCDVKTLFRDKNLGCKYAVSEAISWFFENEEMGIILEDDCLPEPSFFPFCEELLVRFRDNERVFMISGRNDLGTWKQDQYSYFFTTGSIWGWATWRRAWRHFDFELKSWTDEGTQYNIKEFSQKAPYVVERIVNGCRNVLAGNIDTWDYQWAFTRITRGALGVIPAMNLVSNIGFGKDATHTTSHASTSVDIPVYTMPFPLRHNSDMCIDFEYIKKRHKMMQKSVSDRLKSQLKNYCRKLLDPIHLC